MTGELYLVRKKGEQRAIFSFPLSPFPLLSPTTRSGPLSIPSHPRSAPHLNPLFRAFQRLSWPGDGKGRGWEGGWRGAKRDWRGEGRFGCGGRVERLRASMHKIPSPTLTPSPSPPPPIRSSRLSFFFFLAQREGE